MSNKGAVATGAASGAGNDAADGDGDFGEEVDGVEMIDAEAEGGGRDEDGAADNETFVYEELSSALVRNRRICRRI